MNNEEEMFLQQQIENEFMNEEDDDESDDGLVLAGEGTAGIPPINQLQKTDSNMEENFQK